jgi:selenide,water dikinase
LKDLVLLGGGHSNVEVLRQFGSQPMPGVRLTLMSRGMYTPYSGMLPGLIAGHYTFEDAHIDLQRLARFAGARALFDEAIGLDPVNRMVHCRSGPPVSYDLLSINIGSTPNVSVPGAAEHAIAVKPIDRFLEQWDALRHRIVAEQTFRSMAVVGGGAGGVELLLSVQHRLRTLLAVENRAARDIEFHLFSASETLLPTHNRRVRAMFDRLLHQRGVRVHRGREIVSVEERALRDARGTRHAIDAILWTTQARAATWLGDAGIATDEDGFVRVSPALESVSHPGVFAAGDVASLVGRRLQKSGVYAVREGQVLAPNLRRALSGAPLRAYRPQRQFLSLISTGNRYAIASRGPFAFQGHWVWRWKEAIDRAFMRKYKKLPVAGPGDSAADAVQS